MSDQDENGLIRFRSSSYPYSCTFKHENIFFHDLHKKYIFSPQKKPKKLLASGRFFKKKCEDFFPQIKSCENFCFRCCTCIKHNKVVFVQCSVFLWNWATYDMQTELQHRVTRTYSWVCRILSPAKNFNRDSS